MIKWPEPVGGAYVRTFQSARETKTEWIDKVYTEAQLKQAVRDAYEDAAKTCDRLRSEQVRYFNGMGSAGCPEYGPSDCADAIRALIKEVE